MNVNVIGPTEVVSYLELFANVSPENIIPVLEVGTPVRKSLGCFYRIDDTDVDQRLGYHGDRIPLGCIYNAFNSIKMGDFFRLFEENGTQEGKNFYVPFSCVIDRGIGDCVERAVLVQLCAQRRERKSFLVVGGFQEGDSFFESHAFNIAVVDDKPVLIDSMNPFEVDGHGNVTPYCIPISGIEGDTIFVPECWRLGRTYTLC